MICVEPENNAQHVLYHFQQIKATQNPLCHLIFFVVADAGGFSSR